MSITYLQIGSWNIEHLSKQGGRKESPYALVDHMEMAGVQILALQEIYVTHTEGDVRRNADLDRVCELLAQHGKPGWQYELLPKRDPSHTTQLAGVMWDSEITTKGETVKVDVPTRWGRDRLWDRPPYAIKFTTEVDVWKKDDEGNYFSEPEEKSIVVIPLHMKSNFNGSTIGKRVRRKEATELSRKLDWVRENIDPSVVLIGDTNCLDKDEDAIKILVDAGFEDLNDEDVYTYPKVTGSKYGPSPFDRALVAADRPEFQYSRQYVLQSASADLHDKFLSDHYMIKCSVKIYLDDSDPR